MEVFKIVIIVSNLTLTSLSLYSVITQSTKPWDFFGLAVVVCALGSASVTAHFGLMIVYNVTYHPLASTPGPITWAALRFPYVWALLNGTIIHDFEKLHRKYGPVVRTGPDEVSFASGQAWVDIFQGRPGHKPFLKDPVWWTAQPGQADSIITAIQPDAHARIRKVLAPAFTPRAIRAQEDMLQRYINLLIERLNKQVEGARKEKGIEVDMVPWLNYTTFDIFGELGFGESFDCLQQSKYHPWIELLFHSVKAASFIAAARYYPLLEWVLIKSIPPSLRKMQTDHYQQIVEKVQRRMSWELERPDIMSYVIKEMKEEKGLPEGVIYSTFMVLTTGGSETTATVLSGILNYLVSFTDKLAILTEEIRGRFATLEEITLVASRELPYLDAVINEGLRLCPPVPWILPRRAPPGGATVCGAWIPGGTSVSVQPYTINRDTKSFTSALEFLPERWLSESKDPRSPFCEDKRDSVQTFSVGPAACIGQHLAWAEMRLILAKLLWKFDLEAAESKKIRWEDLRTFVLLEKRPIFIKLKQRKIQLSKTS